MVTSTIRMTEEARNAAIPILSDLGLSMNAYLNLALRQLAIHKEVPFRISQRRPGNVWERAPRLEKHADGFLMPKEWTDDDED